MPKLNILFEDNALLIVNKPAGLLALPDRYNDDVSVLSITRQKYPDIALAHRIDKETSGVLCLVKDKVHLSKVATQFENRIVEKTYLAIVDGIPETSGSIEAPLAESLTKKGTMVVTKKGKLAITHYQRLETLGRFSLLRVNIETGRMHQIRVHLQHLGFPLMVDSHYGNRTDFYLSEVKRKYKGRENERPLISRQTLHAAELKLKHPISGKYFHVEASIPKDMRAVLNQLRKLSY